MVIRLSLLAITLLLLPVMALGQSYEWSDRAVQTRGTTSWQVEATEFGIYSVGVLENNINSTGILSKFHADDGQLLWRRNLLLETYSPAYSLTVDAHGVFVAGNFSDTSQKYGSYVRRYSHDGDIVWTVRDRDDGGHTAIDSDADGLYVAGTDGTTGVLRHLSFAGELLWTRLIGSGVYFAVVVGDGHVFVTKAGIDYIEVYRTNGQFVRLIPTSGIGPFPLMPGELTYANGFLYTVGYFGVTKYGIDGAVIWNTSFDGLGIGDVAVSGSDYIAIAAAGDGLVVTATLTTGGENESEGIALLRLDLNGVPVDIEPFWGHPIRISPAFLSALDGALYVAGWADRRAAAFTARYSDKDLIRPAILALKGAAPAQPPRLAVLHHDYGAGPVRVGIRDAAPGSIEYTVGFDDDFTPIAFDKVADLNGNGYEELVVVSRLPAIAEVRDSLDGSLLSRIKLGERFEPLAADVEERPGQAPRLAVVVRNTSTERLLVRVHNLASGTLLDSLDYIRNFDPVDVLALPTSGAGRRYAVLSRNPLVGSPHKIEIRGTSSAIVENYWTSNDNEPLELALTGTAANPVLGALLDRPDALRARVWQVDLQTGAGSSLNFTDEQMPVAIAVLPDGDGNGYPQLTVLSDTPDGKGKTETRDAQTGVLDRRINFNRNYRPRDVAYLGAVPGFSTSALAVIGLPKAVEFRDNDAPIHAEIVDVDGSKLFALGFRFGM